MARLCYQGHASFRLTGEKGITVYVDPFAGGGYGKAADVILITRDHIQHNRVGLVQRKVGCQVITPREALRDGACQGFRYKGMGIRATPAVDPLDTPCPWVGYIIALDGIKLYVAGDTYESAAMGDLLGERLDYALLPVDGEENMDAVTASICAARIGARHTIPIHTLANGGYDVHIGRKFDVPGRIILKPGDVLTL